MIEEWRDIPDFEGYYQASNQGGVRSVNRIVISKDGVAYPKKGRTLKPWINQAGYYCLALSTNDNKYRASVHQLIAMTFLSHERQGYKAVVDHIDNDKLNNHVDNLQVISHRENCSKDRANGTSKYTGVSWCAKRELWQCYIQVGGKGVYLGHFKCETKAHLSYQTKLKTL